MRTRRNAVLAIGVALGMLVTAAPAAGKGGEVVGDGDRYHLTNSWAGVTHLSFVYGRSEDRVYVGNWDGRGTDTLAVRRGATYHFRNSLSGGAADRVVTYGREGDTVLMGDWDGDGIDTPTVRRGNTYHVKNEVVGGEADEVITYGRADDEVLVGDWDGDGVDTLGVRRGSDYHLKNSISGGEADSVVTYGRGDDEVVVGDWDGRRGDTLGIRRGDVFHVKNTIAGGNADIVMPYGQPTDAVAVGDWNADGRDTIGMRSTDGTPAAPAVDDMAEYDERMIEMINAERIARGIAPVRAWPELRPAAVRHSAWMAERGGIEHASWGTISADANAAGCTAASEHIVRTWQRGTAPDPRDAMDWYMGSTVHRTGILNPSYRYVATGSVESGNNAYNTQRFARACS